MGSRELLSRVGVNYSLFVIRSDGARSAPRRTAATQEMHPPMRDALTLSTVDGAWPPPSERTMSTFISVAAT